MNGENINGLMGLWMFVSLAHVNVQSCIIEFSIAGFYLAQKFWERYSWTNGPPWCPKGGGCREPEHKLILVFPNPPKQYFMSFNLTFYKVLGGKQNLLEGKHTLLGSMQINSWVGACNNTVHLPYLSVYCVPPTTKMLFFLFLMTCFSKRLEQFCSTLLL